MTDRYFRSYQDVEDWFSKARDPNRGRPFAGGARIYKLQDGFRIAASGFQTDNPGHLKLLDGGSGYLHIWPDDVLEVVNHEYLRNASFGMTRLNYLSLNFLTDRGRFFIVLTGGRPRHRYEVYTGLQFRLRDMLCLNPLPDEDELDPVIRRDWRNKLIAYKKGVLLRVRMGGPPKYGAPILNHTELEKKLPAIAESIRNQDYSVETLNKLYDVLPHHRDATKFIEYFNDVMTRYSYELRRCYGVYGERVKQLKLEGKL